MSNHYSNHNWMASTPAIDTLSLSELSLPGTHNAGSDWKASYGLLTPRHFVACQHDSFYAQLNHGSRALDLRFVCMPKTQGIKKFRLHHGGFLSSRTLEDLLTDVRKFLSANPDEFIILDCHELSESEGDFDAKMFSDTIKDYIGPLVIRKGDAHQSLAKLKQASALRRILLAAPAHPDLDHELFTRQVRHQWNGTAAKSHATLKDYIGEVINDPPGKWSPWSLSAAAYFKLGGPVDIHDELDIWFDPSKNNWAAQCNIINVDFMEESKIVDYCRTANLAKVQR